MLLQKALQTRYFKEADVFGVIKSFVAKVHIRAEDVIRYEIKAFPPEPGNLYFKVSLLGQKDLEWTVDTTTEYGRGRLKTMLIFFEIFENQKKAQQNVGFLLEDLPIFEN